MRQQRLAGLLVLGGVALLVVARLLTPRGELPLFVPAVLVNAGVALFIFVPLYLVERRLSEQVQQVSARLNRELATFRKEREAATSKAVQLARTGLQEALQQLKEGVTGSRVSAVMALAERYGTAPALGVRVRLPTPRSFLWLRVGTATAEEDTPARLAVFIARCNRDKSAFVNEVGWFWPDERDFDDIMGQEIWNWLVENNEYPGDSAFISGNVPAHLLQVLSLPLEVRAGLSRDTTGAFDTPLLAVVNDEWAIAQDGLVSLTADFKLPVQTAIKRRTARRTVRGQPWVRREAFEEALEQVGNTPRIRAGATGWRPAPGVRAGAVGLSAVLGVTAALIAAWGYNGNWTLSATAVTAAAVLALGSAKLQLLRGDEALLAASLIVGPLLGAAALVLLTVGLDEIRSLFADMPHVPPVSWVEGYYLVGVSLVLVLLGRVLSTALLAWWRRRAALQLS